MLPQHNWIDRIKKKKDAVCLPISSAMNCSHAHERYDMFPIQVEISVSGSLATVLIRILWLCTRNFLLAAVTLYISQLKKKNLLQDYQPSATGVNVYCLRVCLKIPLIMLDLLLVWRC